MNVWRCITEFFLKSKKRNNQQLERFQLFDLSTCILNTHSFNTNLSGYVLIETNTKITALV